MKNGKQIEYVVASRVKVGNVAENRVATYLAACGLRVDRRNAYGNGYDMLVNGKYRVEVKNARCSDPYNPQWMINFHRHGKLDERNVDLYIVRLDGILFFKAGVYLIFRAPIKRLTMRITARSLLYSYSSHARMMLEFVKSKGKRLPALILSSEHGAMNP